MSLPSEAGLLTLYGRRECHLCEEMDAALAPLAAAFGCRVVHIDIDSDPALVARFGRRIPVLMHGEDLLAEARLDSDRVRDYLAKLR